MRAELAIACLAMAAVTYLCRSALTVSVSRVRLTRWWEHFMAFIPLAVLTALVTPYLFLTGPDTGFSILNPYSLAGAATFFLSWRTRNLIISVMGGMVMFRVLGGVM